MRRCDAFVRRKSQLHALIDAEAKERMKREAAELGMTLSAYVNLCTIFFQDATSTAAKESGGGLTLRQFLENAAKSED